MADRVLLPSRREVAASRANGYKVGLFVAGIVDAYASGRLVDREVTADMEKMWVCLFDGPNPLCSQGKMTSKHQELCGEFWLLPVDAALVTDG